MPVRTAYAGAAVAGEVLTAANVNKLPGGGIGHAEATANQGGIVGTAVDLTGLTVTVTVGASRRLRISAQCSFFSTVADDYAGLSILADGAQVQAGTHVLRLASTGQVLDLSAVVTPAAGSRTYKLQGFRAAGTGTLSTQASATGPAFILVEDIGPAT